MAGSESLISNEVFIKAVVDGFQRRYAKPKKRKEPITPEILLRLVETMGSSPTLSSGYDMFALAYAAFLRFDEVAKLRCCDVGIKQDRMDIVINYSKTDQYRQGAVVPIARSGLCTCPVAMMELYWRLGSISGSSEEKLFRAISCSDKKGEFLRSSGGLSYTRMREIVMEKLEVIWVDTKQFGLYSFRAGGATAAANNPSVSERLFKRHGRWKSETAKDGYVKDALDRRLLVSKGLGI